MKKLVVIVPAYNEEKSIITTIDNLFSIKEDLEKCGVNLLIHVINDGSMDATAQLAEEHGIAKVISHKKNRGLGAAVRTGIESANKINADLVVKFDADLQHSPEDVVSIIQPLLNDEADVVYGNRFDKISYKMPFVRRIGNKIFTNLMRWLTNWPLKDSQPGIFAVNDSFLSQFYLPGDYNYTQQILLDACNRNLRFAHVSVSFSKRDTGKSFISLKYPIKVIPQIIQVITGVKPLKVFAPIGLLFLSLGTIVFIFETISYLLGYSSKPVESANLVLGTCIFGIQILFFGLLADLFVKMNRNLMNEINSLKDK